MPDPFLDEKACCYLLMAATALITMTWVLLGLAFANLLSPLWVFLPIAIWFFGFRRRLKDYEDKVGWWKR